MSSPSNIIAPVNYMPFPLLLLLIPLFIFFPIFLRHKFSKSLRLPPGPNPWPFIGNLPLLMGNKLPHVTLAHLSLKHGQLISLRLGSQLMVVGSSPAAAAEILKTHDDVLSGRSVPDVSFAKDPQLNKNAIAWTVECTDQWRFLRSLTRNEIFSSKMVDAQSRVREKKAGEMVAFLGGKEGERVQIRSAVFVYTFNAIANLYFSRDVVGFEGWESERICGVVREMMELYATPNVSDWYPFLGGLDVQGLRRRTNGCVSELRMIWEDVIRERRGSQEKKKCGGKRISRGGDFLDALLREGFSDIQISFLFVELLAAVSDSSSSTVEWALSELLRNPESMKKVQQELAQEIPHEDSIKESNLTSLTHLHACIKETLRLHPPAPLLLPHRATKDCEVMNYTVPENSQVFVNVWAIGRDPCYWEDPLKFKPERFLMNSNDLDYRGNHFEFLPFGSGRRICPGLGMSIRKIQLALASLIHKFDFLLPDNMLPHEIDMEERYGITLMKQHPLVVIPIKKK